ncbi:MAG: hypothetical protein KAR20_06215 [Candidatus Heimdallarchaeota archaeon]|nr:hypothetical protein [Candidatus Heimdallarchaeota archaeon]
MALTENILVIKEFTEEPPDFSGERMVKPSTFKLIVEIEFRCSITDVLQSKWIYEYERICWNITEGARGVVQDFLNWKAEPKRLCYSQGESTIHTGINHRRIELQGGLKELFEHLFDDQNWNEIKLIK